jgi:hypothetical protein
VRADYLFGTDSWPVSAGIGFGKEVLRFLARLACFILDPRNRSLFED